MYRNLVFDQKLMHHPLIKCMERQTGFLVAATKQLERALYKLMSTLYNAHVEQHIANKTVL